MKIALCGVVDNGIKDVLNNLSNDGIVTRYVENNNYDDHSLLLKFNESLKQLLTNDNFISNDCLITDLAYAMKYNVNQKIIDYMYYILEMNVQLYDCIYYFNILPYSKNKDRIIDKNIFFIIDYINMKVGYKKVISFKDSNYNSIDGRSEIIKDKYLENNCHMSKK